MQSSYFKYQITSAESYDERGHMDLVQGFIFVVLAMQSLILVFAIVGILKIAGIALQVEESTKKIAEMANRTERLAIAILEKVHTVSTPGA
jgi:hypothetical protein